ncbi:type 1 glutamine amidotransferase [Chitinolyticbacter meiyuanensis]|uniref:type 1 glutamine amidotransferase n=1 Tax=Chitinolyticbacter meiyuanensis TaxID=682798 RepID=UPI0011E5E9FB|nr:type 1 glutamine amidotransferase [Chitinolyticbacter meiyuanensis]
MKPVAILRHDPLQGPGYLLDFLVRHGIPHRLFAIDAGDTPPTRASEFSGVVVLGSPASVNDGLLWMRREERLLVDALHLSVPILGHCFGGQMLARALGAEVRRNPVPQIGWGRVFVTQFDESRRWFGPRRELQLFHWHYETFAIPRGARRVLFGSYCMNKGFAYGPHLGVQSHLEVTEATVRSWCAQGVSEIADHAGPAVQDAADLLADLPAKVAALHCIADQVYGQWASRLARPVLLRPHGGEGWGRALNGG